MTRLYCETRWCRIHAATQHAQLAVCRFDQQPLTPQLECTGCGQFHYRHLTGKEPHWRCVQDNVNQALQEETT